MSAFLVPFSSSPSVDSAPMLQCLEPPGLQLCLGVMIPWLRLCPASPLLHLGLSTSPSGSPPWTVFTLPPPQTSGPLAASRSPTPLAASGSSLPLAPPQSSLTLAPPQFSNTLAPPRALITMAPPRPPGPSVSPGLQFHLLRSGDFSLHLLHPGGLFFCWSRLSPSFYEAVMA